MGIFSPIIFGVCFGCSKEPSHGDGSFEHPKHMLKIMGKKIFTTLPVTDSYLLTKTYVVDTQKNRLHETVLLSTQNICQKLWVRKYLQFYADNFCLSKSV